MPDIANHSGPVGLKPRVRYRAVDGDGVLLHLETGRVLVVNEVGLRILELLRRPVSKTSLSTRITEEFDVTPEQAASDVDVFLEELDAEQVLELQAAGEAS